MGRDNEIQQLIIDSKVNKRAGNLDEATSQAKQALVIIQELIKNSTTREVRQSYSRLFIKVKEYADNIRPIYIKSDNETNLDEDSVDIEPVEKPNVTFDDIIGHEIAKNEIRENLIEPIEDPSLNEKYLIEVYKGLLLFGPPGTGKTTFAKAVANQIDAEFYNIKCSSIFDKYVGSSEKKLESIFAKACKSERAIIFFDEIDALASTNDNNTPVADRIIALLKALLEGMESSENVFVLAATNYPRKIEGGIRRRLHAVYLGMPDRSDIIKLIELKSKGRPLANDINFEEIADMLTGYSGSDISKVVNYAARNAKNREKAEKKNNPDYDMVIFDGKITKEDYYEGISHTNKTVSSLQIADFEKFLEEYNSNI